VQDWYARFQSFLLECLRGALTLPLRRADMLRAVLHALSSEDLLAHRDTVEVGR
jgi:hypothetical protein